MKRWGENKKLKKYIYYENNSLMIRKLGIYFLIKNKRILFNCCQISLHYTLKSLAFVRGTNGWCQKPRCR